MGFILSNIAHLVSKQIKYDLKKYFLDSMLLSQNICGNKNKLNDSIIIEKIECLEKLNLDNTK